MFLYWKKDNVSYKKYMIVSYPRTGSTMLSKMISYHPEINGMGECFDRIAGRDPQEILANLFSKQKGNIKAVGFNIHFNHPVDEKNEETWALLKSDKDIHIIFLSRKNLLRVYMSAKIANKVKLFRLYQTKNRPDIKERQVVIEVEEFKNFIDEYSHYYNLYRNMFSSHPNLHLNYEDIVNAPDIEFLKVTDFLSLPFHNPKVITKVMNPEPLSQLIINYSTLKEAYKDSVHGWMFD